MSRAGMMICVASLLATASAARAEEQDVAALVRQLDAGSSDEQSVAARKLERLGKEAVPELKRALMAASLRLRFQATKVLARIGPAAADATDLLIENLVDDYQPIVAQSARALGRLRSEPALAALRELAEDPDRPDHRVVAYQGLALGGRGGIAGLRAPIQKGRQQRHFVFQALGALGHDALDALTLLAQDPSWHVRLWTIQLSPKVSSLPDAWLDVLAAASRDESSAVALAAVERLSHSNGKRVVEPLTQVLSEGGTLVRREAAYGLAQQEQLGPHAVEALREALDSPDGALVRNAAWALRHAPERSAVEDALLGLLGRREQDVGVAAAAALVDLGHRGPAVVPRLVEAVRRFGGIAAPFTLYLRSRDLATGGRKKFGGRASSVSLSGAGSRLVDVAAHGLDEIERAARRTDTDHRVRFVFVLGHAGPAAAGSLWRLAQTGDVPVRMAAACALARLGARGRAAVPTLLETAVRRDEGDPVVVKAGESLEEAEVVSEEPTARVWPRTSWIRESRDALLAIGPVALPDVERAAAKSDAVAARLHPVIEQLRKRKREAEGK